MIRFREVDDPAAWRIDVVVDGKVCGRIYRGEGTYRYFEGPLNDVMWSLADRDLDRLKASLQDKVSDLAV
jgi:hypothetical protein